MICIFNKLPFNKKTLNKFNLSSTGTQYIFLRIAKAGVLPSEEIKENSRKISTRWRQ